MYIAHSLPDHEKHAIKSFHEDYASVEEPGAGAHYWYWYALTLFGEKQFTKAKDNFIIAYQRGLEHWRILWFIAQSAKFSGDLQLSREAAQTLLQKIPDFEPARKFLQ